MSISLYKLSPSDFKGDLFWWFWKGEGRASHDYLGYCSEEEDGTSGVGEGIWYCNMPGAEESLLVSN